MDVHKKALTLLIAFGIVIVAGLIVEAGRQTRLTEYNMTTPLMNATDITADNITARVRFYGDGTNVTNTSAFVTVAKDGSGDFNCYGKNDCTDIIQAAFDSFGTNPADVRMKVGVYQLKSYGIDMCSAGTRQSASWTGCGFGCSWLNASFVGNVTWCDRSSLGTYGISTINIKDMLMFGNGSTDNFILLNESMSHGTFENLRLEGRVWAGGSEGQATGSGIYFGSTGGQYDNVVRNVRIKNATYGIRFNTPDSTGKKNNNAVYDTYCSYTELCLWVHDGYNNDFYGISTDHHGTNQIQIRLDDADETTIFGVDGGGNDGVINVSINSINVKIENAFVANITYHPTVVPIILGGNQEQVMPHNWTMASANASIWSCGPTGASFDTGTSFACIGVTIL